MSNNGYPDNWDEVANATKAAAGNKCERCSHDNERETGYILTTHHLNKVKNDIAEGNLAALCQRCHLHVEAWSFDFLIYQLEMFEPFEFVWLKPHLDKLGIPIPEPKRK